MCDGETKEAVNEAALAAARIMIGRSMLHWTPCAYSDGVMQTEFSLLEVATDDMKKTNGITVWRAFRKGDVISHVVNVASRDKLVARVLWVFRHISVKQNIEFPLTSIMDATDHVWNEIPLACS